MKTMLKDAQEMKAVATKERERLQAVAAEAAEKLMNEEIAPLIEEAAMNGKLYVPYHLPANVNANIIIGKLHSHGYMVSRNYRTLEILWN